MPRLNDPQEMSLIYEKCKQVYSGEITRKEACSQLQGKTVAAMSSLNMYFDIYASMRKGTCYKMGTSAPFTSFLIESIYSDFGLDAFLTALTAAKKNAEYRISCGNPQPGIEAVCRELIAKHNLTITYDELEGYKSESTEAKTKPTANPEKKKETSKKPSRREKTKGRGSLVMQITYGSIKFKAEGTPTTVLKQLKQFSNTILPKAANTLEQGINKVAKQKDKNRKQTAKAVPVPTTKKKDGELIKEKYPQISDLQTKMDFKARMIPLLYLAEKYDLRNEFSIKDIQDLMKDTLGENAEKKQIEDVFARRAEWFEKTNNNPRKYKLLDVARDYSINIIGEL